MTSDTLSVLAGVLLSLVFSYLPNLRGSYAAQAPERRALVNLVGLLAVGIVVYGLSCAGLQRVVVCSEAGPWSVARTFFLAAVGNQVAYGITKRIAPAMQGMP